MSSEKERSLQELRDFMESPDFKVTENALKMLMEMGVDLFDTAGGLRELLTTFARNVEQSRQVEDVERVLESCRHIGETAIERLSGYVVQMAEAICEEAPNE